LGTDFFNHNQLQCLILLMDLIISLYFRRNFMQMQTLIEFFFSNYFELYIYIYFYWLFKNKDIFLLIFSLTQCVCKNEKRAERVLRFKSLVFPKTGWGQRELFTLTQRIESLWGILWCSSTNARRKESLCRRCEAQQWTFNIRLCGF